MKILRSLIPPSTHATLFSGAKSAWIRLVRLAILSPIVVLLAFSQDVEHERWSIKTSYATSPNTPRKIKLSTLLKLGSPKMKAGETKTAYNDKLLPGKFGTFTEGDYIETTGWLFLAAYEKSDEDYHIQISGSSKSGDNCVIVEVPDPANAKNADTREHWTAGRSFIDGVNNGKRPAQAGKKFSPVFVRVRGQLFFDLSHLKKDGTSQQRGKKNMKAGTLWEIHPVWEIAKAKYSKH